DYARLEANLRLWCLTLRPGRENVSEAAWRLERHLLDHFHGGEGGLEPVRELAAALGADPAELYKLAQCVAHVRRRAAAACDDFADRRDYLAVLFLTVLSLLQYAGDPGQAAPPENYRGLVSLAWVLEDTLARLLGLPPFDRQRVAFEAPDLIDPGWLAAPHAPRRVRYLLERDDGGRVLEPVAATRGVVQNTYHHLDVLDHTLLVL